MRRPGILLLLFGMGLVGSGVGATPVGQIRTLDDRLIAVAREAPAFGGMFVDEARDTLVVHVVDMADREVVRRAILEEFSEEELTTTRMTMVRAHYSILELAEWRARLNDLLSLEGVVFIDMNEGLNRVQIGYDKRLPGFEFHGRVADLGIPEEAALVTPADPIVPMLRARRRPVVGGLQINFPGFLCTLGFTSWHPGVGAVGFVTNSHCTSSAGGNQQTPYWQPAQAQGNFIGTERRDPPFFTNASDPNCPPDTVCRYSDAAWIIGVDWAQYRRMIARVPLGFDPATESWNPANRYRITAKGDVVVAGVTINKVGRTTGRTRGQITQTCVNVGAAGTDPLQVRLCETIVEGPGTIIAGGDSGSAAFRLTGNPNQHDVRLVGIAWGGSGGTMVYSPVSHVQAELGTLRVCASGFSC